MALPGRFEQTAVQVLEQNFDLGSSDNRTLKANRGSARLFKDYLIEKGITGDFEDFDDCQLDENLGNFYLNVRRLDGSLYKATSLESIRHGLNRYLKRSPFNKQFDLMKDPQFRGSNQSFKVAVAELKRHGKGDIEHNVAITKEDRAKLYTSPYLSTDIPNGLLNKVQYDIRLYFRCRGSESMFKMTKSTFKIHTDASSGRKYVIKANCNFMEGDKPTSSGVMPDSPGSKYCPVGSFQKYLNKLYPDNDRLWQRPRKLYAQSDEIWYSNVAVGENTHSGFMTSLSKLCGLSQVYTNQSIRVTGAAILFSDM